MLVATPVQGAALSRPGSLRRRRRLPLFEETPRSLQLFEEAPCQEIIQSFL